MGNTISRFFKHAVIALVLLPSIFFAANKAPYVAGKHYQVIKKVSSDLPTKPNKITVLEFFSYGCHWCFKLESHIEAWQKTAPKNVYFVRVPVIFQPSWVILAKAYYTAEALDVETKLSPVIFDAVQVKNLSFSDPKVIEKLFVDHGVKAKDFKNAFYFSPGIDAQMMHGRNLMKDYGIYQVPTIIVGGRYKTDPTMAGGFDKLIPVVDYLVKLSQKSTQ